MSQSAHLQIPHNLSTHSDRHLDNQIHQLQLEQLRMEMATFRSKALHCLQVLQLSHLNV